MPRERTDFIRESGSKDKEKIIVLAYEGADTERLYFEAVKNCHRFNKDLIELHALKRPPGDHASSPRHVFSKLKREAKDEYNFGPKDELWMVIDTDRWRNIPEIVAECQTQKNMFAAVSNPCFELWLLLHRQDISGFDAAQTDAILKNRKNGGRRTHVERLLMAALGGSYNKSNIRADDFIPGLDQAIIQAKDRDAAGEDYPTVVGSHVYKIVEKIILPGIAAAFMIEAEEP
ncbi:RloB family protein [Chitinophaga sancti]|uniref:RloB family protein n=1 Tax=Chitinophaga sancti TaxID=1004 RepID=A0A1K1NDW4_9BACT|nr:RloB family protein [Chitinophaga sancti]WQD63387.1 RloB family protein [Chitinophaga sancti]WQG90987.1 RloB family protein [Chitinophaga sancti]SFW32582.1 RloB-like protein [Chitinophaga sancti]